MDKEKLTWRTFADPGTTISARWNAGPPTYYVIDPKGVIRYRWTGRAAEKEIDAALEELIAPETRGDPMSPLRWTCKSTRQLAEAAWQSLVWDVRS